MDEQLDIYDDNLNHLGIKSRVDVHRDGDWHCVFHCWVIWRDEVGNDWIVFQKRASSKASFPDYLDTSAAGHYAAGETIKDGVREVEEELGLDVDFEALIPVGRRISMAIYNRLIDREVADVFFYICDQPLSSYQYQHEELAGLIQVNLDDGLALFAGEKSEITVHAVGLGQDIIQITQGHFVPTRDNYYYRVMVLARRCLNGEKHLVI